MTRNKLFLAAFVVLVVLGVVLTFRGVKPAGQPGGGAGDIIKLLL